MKSSIGIVAFIPPAVFFNNIAYEKYTVNDDLVPVIAFYIDKRPISFPYVRAVGMIGYTIKSGVVSDFNRYILGFDC